MLCDETVILNLLVIEKHAFRTVRIEPKIYFLLCHGGWNGFVCLKGKTRTPTDDLIPKTRHTLAIQILSASKDVYRYSFFLRSIRDWMNL